MIGIWIGTVNEYKKIKNNANNFGILSWDFEDLSLLVDFSYLKITIGNSAIATKPYQKKHQPIPIHLALLGTPKEHDKCILYIAYYKHTTSKIHDKTTTSTLSPYCFNDTLVEAGTTLPSSDISSKPTKESEKKNQSLTMYVPTYLHQINSL